MNRILLTGRNGQLGSALAPLLQPFGQVLAFDAEEVNLADAAALRKAVRDFAPSIVINPAAYTAVDQAEEEFDLAMAVNATAPAVLAEEAHRLRALFFHFSTDYVFDGEKGSPYVESDPPRPLNAYGFSKLEGEQAVRGVGGAALVLRTSWVYSLGRGSFVTRLLEWARTQTTMRIVADQTGSPTWAGSLARAVVHLLTQAGQAPYDWGLTHAGLYHLTDHGAVTRYEWARAVLDLLPDRSGLAVAELLPARTDEFPAPARRPVFSALDCGRFTQEFAYIIPAWRLALQEALKDWPG